MDITLLKQLIKVVEKSEITEFSVQEGDLKVRISKNSKNANLVVSQPNSTQFVQNPIAAVPEVTPTKENKKTESVDDGLYEIKSPIVGTFYRAPAPDADPYVQVGDKINSGGVLCIVEAMKLMNEIESDVDGEIVKILIENATPVEFNQPLFLVKKS